VQGNSADAGLRFSEGGKGEQSWGGCGGHSFIVAWPKAVCPGG
jgi:hypothetical protein